MDVIALQLFSFQYYIDIVYRMYFAG